MSARTRSALDAVAAAGSRVVYVTGRPRRWLAPVVEATGHAGLAVVANGALVLDLDDDRVVHTSTFASDLLADVVSRLRAQVPGVLLGVEWADGFAHEADFARGSSRAGGDRHQPEPIVVDDVGLGQRPVLKLLARRDGGEPVGAEVAAALGDDAQVTWSTSSTLAEVSAPGVHKAATLAWLADHDGLGAQDVVAFGDMPNDLQLLGWAGWGVAMGNAEQQVKDVADEITASNEDDGVARVLERWLHP